MTQPSKTFSGVKRRDFLAGAGAFTVGAPLAIKAAVMAPATGANAQTVGPITRVGIYPAIGICRVGGSDQWFYAPEVPGIPPNPVGGFKDGETKLKKQVQRFRVYGFDDQGNVVQEITDGNGYSIDWTVHVANTKPAWYGFNNPLDQGELAPGLPGQRRNQQFVSDTQREQMLIIDGQQTPITGTSTNPDGTDPAFAMGGQFYDSMPVGLGHLQTDDAGRLLVFPPDGISQAAGENVGITSFADNDGWHDDWCDGPVTATVNMPDGSTLAADMSWVACVGPNFAPDIPPISTLYDVISNMNIMEGWQAPPTLPLSFRKDIYPIFYRLGLMEWVSNASFLRQGWSDVGNFSDPAYIAQLADPSPDNLLLRAKVFAAFRDPNDIGDDAFKTQQLKLPFMMGDGVNYSGSPLQWFQFPELLYSILGAWAAGEFVNDLDDPVLDAIETIDDVDLQQQPAALTEAALEPCSGGAFHPGVELTYILRIPQFYTRFTDPNAEPFRIALGDRPSLLQNVGRLLTVEAAYNGTPTTPPPFGPQMAGDLTRWMGLPWQCDAFSCQQVQLQDSFPVPVWWPALLPVDVLPEEYYDQLMRTDLSTEQRARFFESRVAWSRGVAGIGYHANASYWDGITRMIYLWERMGVLEKRAAPSDGGAPSGLPPELLVEVGRGNMELLFDWTPADGQIPLPSNS